jgi:hypothetical protein
VSGNRNDGNISVSLYCSLTRPLSCMERSEN